MATAVVSPGEILLNSVRYPIRGQVHPILMSQFPEKMITGDYTVGSRKDVSEWAITDQRGGIGIEEMDERKDADRDWWSTCNTAFKGHIVLPPLATEVTIPSATPVAFANFNGELYLALGTILAKLNAAGNEFVEVKSDFAVAITDIIPSIGNNLYIFLGDANEYWYMNTSESFTEITNSTYANLGVHWDTKLWKIDSAGQLSYSAAPNSATPSWTNDANLADEGLADNDVQGLYTYYDVNGDDVIYAPTKKGLFVHDFTNNKWLRTQLKTPDHPNSGKGFVHWRDAAYVSAGLDVLKYIPDTPAQIISMGLDRDGGLPNEYNGEITKFIEGYNEFFASLDSSQTPKETYESLTTGSVGTGVLKGADWGAQTFTPSTAHSVRQVKLLLYRVGSPGTITVSIRATDGSGHPTGNDLTSGTSDGDTLTTGTSGEWRAITLTSYALSASTKYAIIVRVPSGDASNNLRWHYNNDSPYAGGNRENSDDSGSSWAASPAGTDYLFEEQGGTRYSSIMAYDGLGWQCKWSASTAYGAMNTGIVSSVTRYALWFDHNDKVYWLPLSRSLRNPLKISGETFASSAMHITPWFDANWVVGNKLALKLKVMVQGDVSADESVIVKYRTDHANTDRDTGWTTVDTIESAGVTTYTFGSNLGTQFKAIQFRFDLARKAADTDETPDVQYAVLSYQKVIPPLWGWRFTIDCTESYGGYAPDQLLDAVVTAAELQTLCTFYYDDNVKYVQVKSVEGERLTGEGKKGTYNVFVQELE